MKITIFESLPTAGKAPISPFGDKTFVFKTFEVEDSQLLHVIANNFILNVPLDISEPVRSFRRKESLKDLFVKNLSYLILDIDKIKTRTNLEKVLQYFRKYKCIISQSRSYNDIDNFNLKGVLFCSLETRYARHALSQIHLDLDDICDVDEAAARLASLNAPTNKVQIVLDTLNSGAKLFEYNDFGEHTPTKKFEIQIKQINKENIKTISDLCLKTFQNMGFVAVRQNTDGSISFKHPSEHKTPGGFFWYKDSPFIMHHFNFSKSVNIFNEIRKLPECKDLLKNSIDFEKLLEFNNNNFNILKVNTPNLEVTPELETNIQSFIMQNDGLFAIKSPMGTGKSTIISHIIHEAQNQDMRILIITNRISVAEDFKTKYNLKIYNADKYQIGDSLICQYDSLWKYSLKFFDIVILDEFVSLMLHCRNNVNNSSINCLKFFASFNKKLVIADAFLTGYEMKYLPNKSENCWVLDNDWRDPVKVFEYKNFNYFIIKILEISKKSKITISSTSLSIINALHLLLMKHGINVVTLTSQTNSEIKRLVYQKFTATDSPWDCLIYSPTLTVGVSNLNNVDYHFHYDSAMTSDVISSIQMIKRTRKAKEIHMFIKERSNFFKTSFDDLRDSYLNNIGRNVEENFLFDVDKYGEPRLSRAGKIAVNIDLFKNITETNHHDALVYFLKYHFANEPKVIETEFSQNILYKYQRSNSQNEKDLLKANLDQFLKLNDLPADFGKIDDSSIKALDRLAEINERIYNIDNKKEIFEIAIKDKTFIRKCEFFKTAKNWFDGTYNTTFLKNKISNLILKNNDFEFLEFCSMLLNFKTKEPLQQKYLKKPTGNLLKILTKCGYQVYNSDIKIPGQRPFECNRDVLKFYKNIKLPA